VPRRVVGRRDRDGGVREVAHLTAHAQEKEGEEGVWGGGQAGQAAYICDSTCCLTCEKQDRGASKEFATCGIRFEWQVYHGQDRFVKSA